MRKLILTTAAVAAIMANGCGKSEPEAPEIDLAAIKTVTIGNQTWTAENLNYKTGKSWCYENNDSNCNKYGRLYDWKTAATVCPSGWHLPSYREWYILVTNVGGNWIAGKKLKAKHGWEEDYDVTDDYGFSALPGGSRDSWTSRRFENKFSFAGRLGYWWTATERDDDKDAAHSWVMRSDDKSAKDLSGDKRDGLSVRCVQDSAVSGIDPAAFKTVKIGDQTWMAQNLNYKTGDSWCYDGEHDLATHCIKYGRLYDWKTALTACPSGWHLPSNEEWDILIAAAGGKETAGRTLKTKTGWWVEYERLSIGEYENIFFNARRLRRLREEADSGNKGMVAGTPEMKSDSGDGAKPNYDGTDSFGFAALPGGHISYNSDNHARSNGAGSRGYWWTATADSVQYGDRKFLSCRYRQIRWNSDAVEEREGPRSGRYSVRCVADNP